MTPKSILKSIGLPSILTLTILLGCAQDSKLITSGVKSGLIATGAKVELVQDGFKFLEGPVSDKAGNLFFTDMDANCIYKRSADGEVSIVREPANNANGLTLDLDGSLLICEQSGQCISKLDTSGKLTTVADSYQGKHLNSPNDVWVHPNGSIYFTDPRYRYPKGPLPQPGTYVFRIAQDRRSLGPVVLDLPKPNGIVGTENGRTLYVSNTEPRKIYKFEIKPDGSLSNRSEFADLGSDGMTLDQKGNLYLTAEVGVTILNPEGEQIEVIRTPQTPANVCFGGADGKTLFITANSGLYSIQMNVAGSR